MYFMHFSRHNRQQWQHFMPHFTSRVARLALLEAVVDVPAPHSVPHRSQHHRTRQLDQADQQRAVRRTAQVVAHRAQQRLRQRRDADALLRLSRPCRHPRPPS